MADIVFILGAGCSVHAGAPVMEGFLDRARDLHRAGKVNDKAAEFELVTRVVGSLQAVHSKTQLDIVNIESILSAVDTARTLKVLPGFRPEEIEKAFESVQWVIVRTLEASMEFPTNGGRIVPTGDYESFAGLIANIRGQVPARTVAILTFNYDIGVDVALASNGVQFNYGLGEGGAGLSFLKLHGSINWTKHAETHAVVAADMREYLHRYQARFAMPEERPRVTAPISTQLIEFFRQFNTPVDGKIVIVPPTLSKSEYQRTLSPVWERAAKELGGAEFIYVIGYSLPESDQFFRLLFGLGTASNVPLREVGVFNPDPKVSDRFKAMLGPTAQQRYRFELSDFNQACAALRAKFPPRQN